MSDLDSWLEDYRPYIASARVCGRADLIAEHQRLDAALIVAQGANKDMLASGEVTEAKRAVQEVQAQIEASEKEFTFQGIGNKAWQDLKRLNPPTEDQRREGLDTNMERFVPALVAAASHEPSISAAQAARMMDLLPVGEFEKLFQAALEANGQVAGPPKSVLAALIDGLRQNGDSSISAALGESLGLSPSDDDDALSTGSSTTTPDES